jgi:hypothetical protein
MILFSVISHRFDLDHPDVRAYLPFHPSNFQKVEKLQFGLDSIQGITLVRSRLRFRIFSIQVTAFYAESASDPIPL